MNTVWKLGWKYRKKLKYDIPESLLNFVCFASSAWPRVNKLFLIKSSSKENLAQFVLESAFQLALFTFEFEQILKV
jgi:hypothetical protein